MHGATHHVANVLASTVHELVIRANATDNSTIASPTATASAAASRPPAYKAVGITLAICSGLFIGVSFVLKKVGLLKANVKYSEEAGEGYGYLKNAYWWSGMTLMIIGEICNFVAYAFVDAILVTPLGALSVVVTTILSAIFLKERLSFVGKVGCFICIVGSIIIVLNAPEQSSAATIQDMQGFVIAPGFLTYAGIVIVGCAFVAFWVGPRYGKKSMLVYLTICSLIGGLSVVATQGLGAAVVAQAGGTPQFNQWFLYVLLVFVVGTLVTEIIFLNKALNIFNAALVTPTYYVYFTSATIVSSAILFRGFKGSAMSIATIVMGFLQICAGVVLLQLSKSAKDVPDSQVLSGDLDQIRTVGEQEEPESEPKADAIRGTAAIIRRFSQHRQRNEAAEAKRVFEEKLKDIMEPIAENEHVEWDGLRRRKTIIDPRSNSVRRKTLHPPLGLTRFPSFNEEEAQAAAAEADINRNKSHSSGKGILSPFRFRAHSAEVPHQTPEMMDAQAKRLASSTFPIDAQSPTKDYFDKEFGDTAYSHHPNDAVELEHVYGLPPPLQHQSGSSSARDISPGTHVGAHGKPIKWAPQVDHPPSRDGSSSVPPRSDSLRPTHQTARRQFSFQKVFHRNRNTSNSHDSDPSSSRPTSRGKSALKSPTTPLSAFKSATEEERLGLVKGDSRLPSNRTSASSEESAASEGGGYFSRSLTHFPEGEGSPPRYQSPPPPAVPPHGSGSLAPAELRADRTTQRSINVHILDVPTPAPKPDSPALTAEDAAADREAYERARKRFSGSQQAASAPNLVSPRVIRPGLPSSPSEGKKVVRKGVARGEGEDSEGSGPEEALKALEANSRGRPGGGASAGAFI